MKSSICCFSPQLTLGPNISKTKFRIWTKGQPWWKAVDRTPTFRSHKTHYSTISNVHLVECHSLALRQVISFIVHYSLISLGLLIYPINLNINTSNITTLNVEAACFSMQDSSVGCCILACVVGQLRGQQSARVHRADPGSGFTPWSRVDTGSCIKDWPGIMTHPTSGRPCDPGLTLDLGLTLWTPLELYLTLQPPNHPGSNATLYTTEDVYILLCPI